MKYTVLAYDEESRYVGHYGTMPITQTIEINQVWIKDILSNNESGAIAQAKEVVSRSYYRVVDVSF